MKQLYNQEDMVDRQITRVENWDKEMFIFFHDNTFVWLIGGAEYMTGDDYGIDFITISQSPINMEYKYSLYLISEEEYDAWCEKESEEYETQNREHKMYSLKKLAEELNVDVELPDDLC